MEVLLGVMSILSIIAALVLIVFGLCENEADGVLCGFWIGIIAVLTLVMLNDLNASKDKIKALERSAKQQANLRQFDKHIEEYKALSQKYKDSTRLVTSDTTTLLLIETKKPK
jgi:hypothetical protein